MELRYKVFVSHVSSQSRSFKSRHNFDIASGIVSYYIAHYLRHLILSHYIGIILSHNFRCYVLVHSFRY